MKLRDLGQQLIYKIINPLIKGMIKIGITPNFITTTGLFLNIVAAVIFMVGGYHGERGDFSYVGWGGFIILFAGLFDMMDGQLARIGKMSSTYGALYDSVLDRYSELITLFGICYYLILQGYFFSSMFAFVALIGSIMVSYVRARAEGLGIECTVGFMQRPERVILVGAGGLLCGIFSHFAGEYVVTVSFLPFPIFEPVLIFVIPLVIVAVFSNVTAIGRLLHCRKVLNNKNGRND